MVNWNIILTVIIITIILIILILLTLNYFNKIENFNTISAKYGYICTYNSNDCTEEDKTLCITEGYSLYACGDNSLGQIGLYSTDADNDVKIPLEIYRRERISINDLDIKSVFCSPSYSLILTNDNKLFLSGENPTSGDTAIDNNEVCLFREIPLNLNIKTIYCLGLTGGTENGFYILTEDGKVYACGYSPTIKFGIGERLVYKPTLVSTLIHETVKDISNGTSHTLYLTEDGEVYGCGAGKCFYNSAAEKYPTLIPLSTFGNKKIANIHAGYEYSVFVTEDGEIYYYGKTVWEQPYSSADNGVFSSSPLYGKKILGIFSSQKRCLFLTEEGDVYGLGKHGAVFNNTEYTTPTKVAALFNIKDIVTTQGYSLFLDNDGTLHSYGTGIPDLGDGSDSNEDSITIFSIMYALGPINNFSSASPSHIGASVLIITEEGGIYSYGVNTTGQLGKGDAVDVTTPYLIEFVTKAIPFDNISQISNCRSNTLFLTADGYVYGCGANSKGHLGLGNKASRLSGPEPVYISLEVLTSLSNIKQLCCLDRSTMVLTDEGRVYACGSNDYSALSCLSTFIDIPYYLSGTAIGNFMQIPITNVNKICHGSYHCFLMLKDGSIYTWGSNASGECGVGHKNLCKTPTKLNFEGINNVTDISAGYSHTLFLMNDGTVYACGQNSGQLGIGGGSANITVPEEIPSLSNIKKIFAGSYDSFFINQTNVLYVCGKNANGQLGTGDTTAVTSPTSLSISNVIDVSSKGDSTIFLKSDGIVFCCGGGSGGQFGYGNKDQKLSPVRVPISDVQSIFAGNRFSLFLKDDFTVYVAGANDKGQIGLGDGIVNQLTFTKFPITDVKTLSAGFESCLLLKKDGSLHTWGDGAFGRLGLGDFKDSYEPALIDFFHSHIEFNNITSIAAGLNESFFVRRDGTVFRTVNSFPEVFPLPNGVIIKEVFVGKSSSISFFLTESGEVYCYGTGASAGQLGVGDASTWLGTPTLITTDNRGDRFDNIKKISSNGSHTLFLKNDGSVYSCGYGTSGQLGVGDGSPIYAPTLIISLDVNVTDISTGNSDSYFLTNTGDVYMCGYLERKAGYAGEYSEYTPIQISMTNITAMSKHYYHEMFVTKYGDVYCTGRNDHGELGIGSLTTIYNPVHVPSVSNIKDIYAGYTTTFFLFNKEG